MLVFGNTDMWRASLQLANSSRHLLLVIGGLQYVLLFFFPAVTFYIRSFQWWRECCTAVDALGLKVPLCYWQVAMPPCKAFRVQEQNDFVCQSTQAITILFSFQRIFQYKLCIMVARWYSFFFFVCRLYEYIYSYVYFITILGEFYMSFQGRSQMRWGILQNIIRKLLIVRKKVTI